MLNEKRHKVTEAHRHKGWEEFSPSLSREWGRWMSSRAFTLIEIMITTAILALLITGIYSIFKGGTDAWTKGNVRMERYQNARAILEMISRELSCAMVNKARKIYMLGVDGETETQIQTYSIKDELYFVAPINSTSDIVKSSNTTNSDLCEMGYWLKGDGSDTEIMRICRESNLDFVFKGETGTINTSLGVAARDLQFYYYAKDSTSDADSHVNWGSGDSDADTYLYKLPKKITIVLKTRDEEAREDTQTFETTVFIPGAE